MTDWTANADTFVGWLGVIGVCIFIAANRLVVLLAWIDRHNEETDATEADDWLDDYGPRIVYGADELPIFDATVAHISKWAASDVDREWAELNGGAS